MATIVRAAENASILKIAPREAARTVSGERTPPAGRLAGMMSNGSAVVPGIRIHAALA
jgi:hypothetical protein